MKKKLFREWIQKKEFGLKEGREVDDLDIDTVNNEKINRINSCYCKSAKYLWQYSESDNHIILLTRRGNLDQLCPLSKVYTAK